MLLFVFKNVLSIPLTVTTAGTKGKKQGQTSSSKRSYGQAIDDEQERKGRALVNELFPPEEDEHDDLPAVKKPRQSPAYQDRRELSHSSAYSQSVAPSVPVSTMPSTAVASWTNVQSSAALTASSRNGHSGHLSSEAQPSFAAYQSQAHPQMYFPGAHSHPHLQHLYNGYPATPEGYAYTPAPAGAPSAQPFHTHPGGYHLPMQYSDFLPHPPNGQIPAAYGVVNDPRHPLYQKGQPPQQGPS